MARIRCAFCSGLILYDHPPRDKRPYHAKCRLKQDKIEKDLGRELFRYEIKKKAKNDRYDYVLEQLNLWCELPWGYSQTWGGSGVKITGSDGIPDHGLDAIEKALDIEERVGLLPEDEKKVITDYYRFKKELMVIAREMNVLTYKADYLRDKAIKRMGEMC